MFVHGVDFHEFQMLLITDLFDNKKKTPADVN